MARKKNQTPPDADIKVMQQFYIDCPQGHEVDHIIPISKGGLHHQDNLQHLPMLENRKKGNKLPGELMAKVRGIEPRLVVLEATVLPLDDTPHTGVRNRTSIN
jgi:HNH endonuclease